MLRMMRLTIVGFAMIAVSAAVASQPGQDLPGPFPAYVVVAEKPKPSKDGLLSIDRQNLSDYGRIGKYHDFVTQFGLDPTVAVITRLAPTAADQPLAKLVQWLDQAVEKNKRARLHGWVVFLGLKDEFLKDESRLAQVKQIEAFGQALNLRNVPLAVGRTDSERTQAYSIAGESTVTVIVYNKLKVVARWDFSADKPLDEAALQTIAAEVKKLVGAK